MIFTGLPGRLGADTGTVVPLLVVPSCSGTGGWLTTAPEEERGSSTSVTVAPFSALDPAAGRESPTLQPCAGRHAPPIALTKPARFSSALAIAGRIPRTSGT